MSDTKYHYYPMLTCDGVSTLTLATVREDEGKVLRVAFALQNAADSFSKRKAHLIAGGRLQKTVTESKYSRNFTMPFVHHTSLLETFMVHVEESNVDPRQKHALKNLIQKSLESFESN